MTIAGLFGTIGVPGKIAISTFLLMSSAGINSLSGMSISPVADEQNVFYLHQHKRTDIHAKRRASGQFGVSLLAGI